MLIGFRLLQAAGAALLTPTSLGLILATFPAERRGSAVRIWAAVGGFAAALGPLVGGLLVTASWRWIFLVNVPIGLAALVVGWIKLPRVPGHDVRAPYLWAAGLITAGVITYAAERSFLVSRVDQIFAGNGASSRTKPRPVKPDSNFMVSSLSGRRVFPVRRHATPIRK